MQVVRLQEALQELREASLQEQQVGGSAAGVEENRLLVQLELMRMELREKTWPPPRVTPG